LLIIALIVVLACPSSARRSSSVLRLSEAEHDMRETQNLGMARAFSSELIDNSSVPNRPAGAGHFATV